MAVNTGDSLDWRTGQTQQLMLHPMEMLCHDVKPGIRQQMVNIGDAAGERIFDWDHPVARPAFAHRGKSIIERCARQRNHIGHRLDAG